MLFGSRAGFGLEFHLEQDPDLLCVDIYVGGLHVDSQDNAFYPPLLVFKLKHAVSRFSTPAAAPVGFTSPAQYWRLAESWYVDSDSEIAPGVEDALDRCGFLEWGECTNNVRAFAFPDGDRVHLACRIRARGDAPWRESAVVSMSRTSLVETLEQSYVVAEREWSVRLAALKARGNA